MSRPTRDQLHRQVAQQLESLQRAGVTFLPKPTSPLPPLIEHPDETMNATLFDETVDTGPDAETRRVELSILQATVADCPRCAELAATRTQTVFGVGPVDAELCLVGEAPGADEDRLGEPFVGAAGQLLNKILSACGFKREDVYICNTLKCRPRATARRSRRK